METPALDSSLAQRLFAMQATVGLLGLSLVGLLSWQSGLFSKSFLAPRSVSPAELVQTDLNAVAVALFSYEQTHNSLYLERIKRDGAKVLEALQHCRQKMGNPAEAADLDRVAESLRSSTSELIATEISQAEALEVFQSRLDHVAAILKDQGEEAIRPGQSNSTARAFAIGAAQSEVRNLAWSLISYLRVHAPESLGAYRAGSARVLSSLDVYRDRTHRSLPWAGDVRETLAAATEAGGKILAMEQMKETLLRQYQLSQRDLAQRLLQISSSEGAALLAGQRPALLWGTLSLLIFSGLFLGLTLRWTRVRILTPLTDLAAMAEAAAAGDITREIQVKRADEMGRLGLSINRLISVLARSENLIYHLAALVESSGEAIVSHTLEGTILSWNKGAQRLYGYSAEEIKGRSIFLLSPLDEGALFSQFLERVKRGEKIKPLEMTHTGKSGRLVHVLMRVASIYDSKKQIMGASLCLQEMPIPSPPIDKVTVTRPFDPQGF